MTMNNKDIYSKRFATYSETQKAYQAERSEMEAWALTRANQHIANAQSILDKHNRNREHKITTLPSLPILGTRYKFSEFTESGLIFTYETTEITGPSWNRKPTKIQKEFLFPTEWLSLSTWDFNKLIRSELKEAIEQQKRELAAEKRKAQSELRKQIRDLNAQAAKLQAQIDTIQKELSA